MAITIVRLGTRRLETEGLRIGTVRRPPRGVAKDRYSADDWYDVWLPNLSPSPAVMTGWRAAGTLQELERFKRKFRAEMKSPDAAHLLDTLAALSRTADFSVGCYCEEEARCHRSVLRALLEERGAAIRE